MMNYKITFNMRTPICLSDMIMFDGLIAYAYYKEISEGVNKQTQPLQMSKDDLIDFRPMPIEHNDEHDYFYASWMLYNLDGLVEFTDSWKKRWASEFDQLADFGGNKRKVRINNAKYKSYNMPMRMLDLDEVWFYFKSREVSKVAHLIEKHVFGIGKKISQGKGLFSGIHIEKTDYDPFKNIIRPILVTKEIGKGRETRMIGCRPPYWHPINQELCIVS